MAVTSIWPIKGRVDKVINYARNPEKTTDLRQLDADLMGGFRRDFPSLKRLIAVVAGAPAEIFPFRR